MYDIIVVGSGPAGATFARLISKQYKVLLIDKYSNKEKCCGGLIAPDAQKVLAEFDIGIPKSIIADPQLLYVRSLDLKTQRKRNYQRHYTNVNRKALDDYIVNLVGNNVTVKNDCFYISHKSNESSVLVRVRINNVEEEYVAKMLIGADGAYSKVRQNTINDFKRIRKYLAIQGEYEKTREINHYAVFFDNEITDFYSWLIPKDNKVLLGTAIKGKYFSQKRFERLEEEVRKTGYKIGKRLKLDACYLLRPRVKDIRIGSRNVALIGEAAGLISPSSAEGLSYAYRSAIALSKVLNKSLKNWENRYKRKLLKLKVNISLKEIKSIVMYNSILRNLVFIAGIASLKEE